MVKKSGIFLIFMVHNFLFNLISDQLWKFCFEESLLVIIKRHFRIPIVLKSTHLLHRLTALIAVINGF